MFHLKRIFAPLIISINMALRSTLKQFSDTHPHMFLAEEVVSDSGRLERCNYKAHLIHLADCVFFSSKDNPYDV